MEPRHAGLDGGRVSPNRPRSWPSRAGDDDTAQRAVTGNVPRVSSQVFVPGSRTRMAVARLPSVFVARPQQSHPGWRLGGTCCRRPPACCLLSVRRLSSKPIPCGCRLACPRAGICAVSNSIAVSFAQWLLRHRASVVTARTLMVNHWEAPSVSAQPSVSRLSEVGNGARGTLPRVSRKHPNAPWTS